MPKINIKKYSRSNTDSSDPQDTETEIKKSRGRPKKIILETDTENNNIIYRNPEPVQEQEETIPETIPETVSDTIENVDISDGYIAEIESPSEPFLEELNTANYIEPPTKEEQKNLEKSFKETLKQKTKHIKIQEKVNSVYESSDLFDENGSEIIGRDRRVIINKLNQYSKGLQKGLTVLDKDFYDEEQQFRDELNAAEKVIRKKNKNVSDDEVQHMVEDYMEEQEVNREIEEEVFDMEYLNEDFYNGNTDGVGAPEEEYDDYNDFD
jgi:hypothetical protein